MIVDNNANNKIQGAGRKDDRVTAVTGAILGSSVLALRRAHFRGLMSEGRFLKGKPLGSNSEMISRSWI